MATVATLAQGTRSGALVTMSTLASGAYIASSAIDLGAAIPVDVTFDVVATPGTGQTSATGVYLFAKFSLDNTNYGTGPESGTSTTDEADLHFLGFLPTATNSTAQEKLFSLIGQPVARYMKLVAKNATGATLGSGFVYRSDITGVQT
jgi:hypothetical protein